MLLLLPWGEDLPAFAAVPGCLLSHRGQAGFCALTAVLGQGCGTSIGSTHWVPPATGALWLEQLQHCSPPPVIQDLITGSLTLKHPQAHPREFSFQAHRRPCLKIQFRRSVNTGTGCDTSVSITMGLLTATSCLCSALGLPSGLEGLCCLTEPWNGLSWVGRDLKDHLITTRKREKWGLNWPLGLQGWKHKTSLQMVAMWALKVL